MIGYWQSSKILPSTTTPAENRNMEPLSILAVIVLACAFGLDLLLLYRQFHIAPWELEISEADPEAGKEAPTSSSQNPRVQPLPNQDSAPNESSPLRLNAESTYDTLLTEEKAVQDELLSSTSPPPPSEWPPPDAPRWIFGFKFSQKFLSPAERPPIFSRWYHGFKLLWPPLIANEFLTRRPHPNPRELHPQVTISILLCMGTIVVKIMMVLLLSTSLHDNASGEDTMGTMAVVVIYEAWLAVFYILFQDGLYWRSRGFGGVAGKTMGRVRMLLFAMTAVAIWVGVWSANMWDWTLFGTVGLPFAMLVGMSYGLAWERWV
ncbi:MAG: hypothetical protein Q9178_005764 [Gyalolechia marmorata]